MNFASDHQPSPHHPPLVPCAGDEGTPSPHHECLYQYHEKNNSMKNAKCLSQDKHVTLAGVRDSKSASQGR